MSPKRRSSGPASKSHQSTLAFHSASNKVIKGGTRAQNAKKNIVSESAPKAIEQEVAEVKEETPPAAADASIVEQTEKELKAQQVQSTPEEDEAKRVSEARIKKYWKAKEQAVVAPRVHQGDLSIHEKILRDFDMSGQYGPCVGIARLKRWKRAHRLDLDPPIEVLAVLLKQQKQNEKLAVQRSHVDELLNSRAEVDV